MWFSFRDVLTYSTLTLSRFLEQARAAQRTTYGEAAKGSDVRRPGLKGIKIEI